MPNRDAHLFVGGAVGVITYCLYRKIRNEKFDLVECLQSGAIGAFSAVAPDLLEPATSPQHRNLAHSQTAFAGLFAGIQKVNEHPTLTDRQKELWTTAGLGYASHLLMDSQTPAGLPFFLGRDN